MNVLQNVNAHWNQHSAQLIEAAICRGEGKLSADGAFVAITAPHTGRSPRDKFLVREPSTQGDVWWDTVNQPIEADKFDSLQTDLVAYLKGRDELFVRDLFAAADPEYRLNVRFISENAWQMAFVDNMFIQPAGDELADFQPQFTVLHAPEFRADPARHGTRSATAIALNLAKKTILICGTRYAGELKKSIFTVLNFLLPNRGAMPMHCSANLGKGGDVALFFGLSGTGKTTLSADPGRRLIGDDEHGWSDRGVFNFEGGCYAKVIRLSPEAEPEIYGTLKRFGTILENVKMDEETRRLDLDSEEITENTRASYPLEFIPNAVIPSVGGHPRTIFFLSADAFGVLPPIGRLTPEQAMYHFISGYTARLAGTERGVTTPQATFSACFGAPFLVWHPTVYANLLARKIREHGTRVWLVNTGWSGGPYGVGNRMKIAHTRAMVNAALDGSLDDVPTEPHPIFGVHMPTSCPGVPPQVLSPRRSWTDDEAYDAKARELAESFKDNFKRFGEVDAAIKNAGPAEDMAHPGS